jgi:hypothetical protein
VASELETSPNGCTSRRGRPSYPAGAQSSAAGAGCVLCAPKHIRYPARHVPYALEEHTCRTNPRTAAVDH